MVQRCVKQSIMMLILGFGALLLNMVTPLATAYGDVIHVNTVATGANDGTSWENAYTDLQDALSMANSGNEIWVAAGTYNPAGPGGDRNASFWLKSGVAIYGGFAGDETQLDQRDIHANSTVLSGDLNGDDQSGGNNSENSYHVVIGDIADSTAVLDGFLITAGNANGINYPYDRGGGMSNTYGSPTLANCIFAGNSAYVEGGGICNYEGNPTLTDCIFIGNSAMSGGGGIFGLFGSLTLINCTFSNNVGEGINSMLGNLTMINCILWGDMLVYDQPPVITHSNIEGGYPGEGNINTDPLFLDPDGADDILGTPDDDLRLSAGSPCIDAGDPDPQYNDRDGTRNDMGAYGGPSGMIWPGVIIYVNSAATGANNGDSWEDAFTDMQDALNQANAGDEIWVAVGTYIPSQVGDRNATFQLISGVALYGGFAGDETERDERDFETNVTILSGDLNEDDGPDLVNNQDNSYHVVTGSGTDSTAIVDGFTITGGNADFGAVSYNGGGMYNEGGSPALSNCTFFGNFVFGFGGGMANVNSNPTLTDCNFSANHAQYGGGGGMFNDENSSPILTSCTFFGNFVNEYDGGGMYNSGADVILNGCTFSDNSAKKGGGIFNTSNHPTITNCTFYTNVAEQGGGMYNNMASPTLANCLFLGNSAGYGGGMYNETSNSPVIINCTLAGNSAIQGGGGIYNFYNFMTLSNSVVWSNTPNQIEVYGYPPPVVTYSNIQGGYEGIGNIDSDPLFVDIDGPDDILGTADDDLRLSAGSPCIDAGDNSAVPQDTQDLDGDGDVDEPLPYDLDGNVRFFDDPDTVDSGNGTPPIVDMGTYEYQPSEEPNNPPELDPIGDKTIEEGQELYFTVSASDADGNIPSLSAGNLPTGAEFTDNGDGTGTFSWTPGYEQSGVYENVHFEATDNEDIVSEDITITVNDMGILVAAKLIDSGGWGVQGGDASYASGSWKTIGTTGIDGIASIVLPSDTGNLKVRMNYGGKSCYLTQNVQENSVFIFQTINVTVELRNSTGTGIEGGEAAYAAGSWYTIGTTNADGQVQMELMPGSYKFRMKYEGKTDYITQDIGTNPVATFQTINVMVELRNSTGTGIEGGEAAYAAGSWHTIGTTGASGQVQKELMPGSYKFRVKYEGKSDYITQDIEVNPVVTFQTINATVKLLDSLGAGIEGGEAAYAAGSWMLIGTTDENGIVQKELIPGTYKVRMKYNGETQYITQDIEGNPEVVFTYSVAGDQDTDGDGLTDEEEVFYGTDPANPDTDDDGLSDYNEIFVYSTDPLEEDTDDDGISDGDEVVNGWDPLDTNDPGVVALTWFNMMNGMQSSGGLNLSLVLGEAKLYILPSLGVPVADADQYNVSLSPGGVPLDETKTLDELGLQDGATLYVMQIL